MGIIYYLKTFGKWLQKFNANKKYEVSERVTDTLEREDRITFHLQLDEQVDVIYLDMSHDSESIVWSSGYELFN